MMPYTLKVKLKSYAMYDICLLDNHTESSDIDFIFGKYAHVSVIAHDPHNLNKGK